MISIVNATLQLKTYLLNKELLLNLEGLIVSVLISLNYFFHNYHLRRCQCQCLASFTA